MISGLNEDQKKDAIDLDALTRAEEVRLVKPVFVT
jgi:hypothetical protein